LFRENITTTLQLASESMSFLLFWKIIDLLTFTLMVREANNIFDGFCHFVHSSIDPGVVKAASVITTVWIL